MGCIPNRTIRILPYCIALGLLAASVVAFAQDPATNSPPSSAPSPGWHSFSNPPAPQGNDPQGNYPQGKHGNPPDNYPQGNYPPGNYPSNTLAKRYRRV